MIRRHVQSVQSVSLRYRSIAHSYRTKATASVNDSGPKLAASGNAKGSDKVQEQRVVRPDDGVGEQARPRTKRERGLTGDAVQRPKSSIAPLKNGARHTLQLQHGSQNHTSLSTFLAHAASTGLSTTSTVYKGTHYEYTVIEALRRLNFNLTRVARSGDQGIDLLGHWTVPSLPSPLRVLAQCKARAAATAAPEQVRELEGAFVGAPTGWRGEGVMGLLVATGKASKGVLDAVGRSRWPLGFLKVSLEGRIEQFVWNKIAEDYGLEGLGVTKRYTDAGSIPQGEAEVSAKGIVGEVALIWQGSLVKTLANDETGEVRKKRGRPKKIRV